jgi:hypothetical protein
MFKKTVLVRALLLAFNTSAISVALIEPVMAQSNASGMIFGRVEATNHTISIKNIDTNLQRKVTPDSNGRYQISSLPAGRYRVELSKGDQVVKSTEVEVTPGQGAEADFFNSQAVQSVQIVGQTKKIDISNTNNGTNFSSRELAKLPIEPNLTSIIQLAPNTAPADPRYLGAAMGGSGPSENSYYINGFPVTNALTGLGSSELPFGAIATAQILTGGFGAEFGRSIGGVVNITTKSGTNRWETGAQLSLTPRQLRSKEKDFFYSQTGAPENAATDGKLSLKRADNTRAERRMGVYVGGPLVEDRLFMFVSAEQGVVDQERVARRASETPAALAKWGFGEFKDTTNRLLAKFDWNINDANRLEATYIYDDAKRDAYFYGYDYANNTHGSKINSGEHYRNDPANNTGVGSKTMTLKYIGNITDDLTFTALYGQLKSPHANTFDGYDVYDVKSSIPGVSSSTTTRYPGLVYENNQALGTANILPRGAEDKVKSLRLDLEYKLGDHSLRVGADSNRLDSLAGFFRVGGNSWTFQKQNNPTVAAALSGSDQKVAVALTPNAGPIAKAGYYVTQSIFTSATKIASEQTALFIEDRWQVSKNVMLSLGLRDETYKNINSEGDAFLDMKKQIAPRFGAAWNVNGDSSFKIFSTAGRYYLQVPTSISVRAPSRSLNTTQAFTYTGLDANGAPTGLTPIAPVFSANNEYNFPKDAKVLAATGLKPNYQDEMTLGFEKAYGSNINFGAKATYRVLRSTLDDYCDAGIITRWKAANPQFDTSKMRPRGCTFINPGEDNAFLLDLYDADPALARRNYVRAVFTKEMLGLPKAERKYAAIDTFVEHTLSNGWYGKISYTWSRSKGNTEGQTRSENAQINPGATTTWDLPQLSEYADGVLPNNRTHALKAYGFYDLNSEWNIGGNLAVATGRPINCLGNHPTFTAGYAGNFFYCGNPSGPKVPNTPSPRGSLGDLPTDVRVNVNLTYRPVVLSGFAFKLDVFNVMNRQTVLTINESYNSGTNLVNPNYGAPTALAAPRSVRLSAEYNKKF